METLADHLRSSETELDLHEILKSPVSLLLGVNDAAVTALESVGIKSVFDLGTSGLFAQADSAIRADWISLGRIPSDVLDDNQASTSVEGVSSLPLEALRAVPDDVAAALKAALGIETIRDLAYWPPRRAATAVVRKAVGGEAAVDGDAFAEKLRPAMGEYPTERVYYDKLVMFGTTGEQGLQPLDRAISLTADDPGPNLDDPAVGALVTLSQSWFVQGVTLGHMIHSLALAPGEATRVAVIDWSRRTSATTAESIAESEQLDNAATHSRAISEVQNAVANEMQRGGSMSSGWAESESGAWTESSSMGLGLAGMFEGVTGALGFSQGGSSGGQWAESRYRASSSSWSVGERSTSASMTQNVNDRTEQHATSVRNRRATAVREVSQSEHEQISTRVIANYNHMHALTVQYYEVVQVYRVVVRPHTFDRVLFLPFEVIDFSAANALDIVARYRGQLLAGSLTARVRGLILDPVGQVEVRSAVRVQTPINIFADIRALDGPRVMARMREETQPVPEGGVQPPPPPPPDPPQPVRTVTRIRRGPLEGSFAGNARLVRISFEGLSVARIRLELANTADAQEFDVPSNDLAVSNVRLADVESILLATADGTEDAGTIALHCEVDGRASKVSVPVVVGSGGRMQTVAFIDADPSDRKGELLAHLQSNRGYYTRAILQGLDSASLVQLLGRFSWNGRPLADQVEPVPVAVAGNYLVLRAPVGNDEPSGLNGDSWGAALAKRGIVDSVDDSRLVPIPTGGVFAEAVLGRSNSAEKLDLTRFWNWQDSPIPLQPPEIAPIAAGSRATEENLVPGQLGAPVLNIMNPTTLPDPAGLSAILTAIANGNMFRDMSGLAGTQAAGRALAEGTMTAATEAGRIASANYKIATDQATEMAKTAADMWKVYQSGGGKDGSNKSVSAEGARVNHGRDMDERGVNRPPSSAAAVTTGEEGSGGGEETIEGGDTSASSAGTDRMEPAPNEWTMSRAGAGMPPLDEITGTSGPTDYISTLEEAFPGVEFTEAQVFRPRPRPAQPTPQPKAKTVQVTARFLWEGGPPIGDGLIFRMGLYEGDGGRRLWPVQDFFAWEVAHAGSGGNVIQSDQIKGVTSDRVTVQLAVAIGIINTPTIFSLKTLDVFKVPNNGDLEITAKVYVKSKRFTIEADTELEADGKALAKLSPWDKEVVLELLTHETSDGVYTVIVRLLSDLKVESPKRIRGF